MAVWTMSMRGSGEDTFEFCRSHSIVGVGWGLPDRSVSDFATYQKFGVDYWKNQMGNRGYQLACTALNKMRAKDLVWVHDSKKKEYYLCEIMGPVQCNYGYDYVKADIVNFLPCTYYYIGKTLPAGIYWRRLIARSAIREVRDPTLIELTQKWFHENGGM